MKPLAEVVAEIEAKVIHGHRFSYGGYWISSDEILRLCAAFRAAERMRAVGYVETGDGTGNECPYCGGFGVGYRPSGGVEHKADCPITQWDAACKGEPDKTMAQLLGTGGDTD